VQSIHLSPEFKPEFKMDGSGMTRIMQNIFALFLALAFGALPVAGCASHAVPTINPDEQRLYEALLDSWLGSTPSHQLVNLRLEAPPSPADPDNADCVKGTRFPSPATHPHAERSLSGVRFQRSGLELVDGKTWIADDPGKSLGRGDIAAAVERGLSHSLITLSQISFSTDHKSALVSFSMACGALCGTGMTVQMRDEGGNWKIVRRCGESIS
jgi:hypothetical protein